MIAAFYDILKCLQILRRFYVKRERIPNFRPERGVDIINRFVNFDTKTS